MAGITFLVKQLKLKISMENKQRFFLQHVSALIRQLKSSAIYQQKQLLFLTEALAYTEVYDSLP
jgi:hypothetical protein